MDAVNVLLLGKSGVGKSALLNYIFEEPIAATGVGRPVTEEGFFEERRVVHGIPLTIIDSWGMEAGKSDEWFSQFDEFVQAHGATKRVEQWIHIALYCIDAQGARVEPFELEVIRHLQRVGIEVIVALTKSGGVPSSQLETLRETIDEAVGPSCTIVPVNSVQMTLLTGEELQTFGREAIVRTVRTNYFKTLRTQLPIRIRHVMEERVQLVQQMMERAPSRKEARTIASYSIEHFYETITSRVIDQELGAVFRLYTEQLTPLLNGVGEPVDDMERLWLELKRWSSDAAETLKKVMKGFAIVLLPGLFLPYYAAKGVKRLLTTKRALARQYGERAAELIDQSLPNVTTFVHQQIDWFERQTGGESI